MTMVCCQKRIVFFRSTKAVALAKGFFCTALFCGAVTKSARADDGIGPSCPAPLPSHPAANIWPLRARDCNPDGSPRLGPPRKGIWRTAGELEHFSQPVDAYLHSGIDIRASWEPNDPTGCSGGDWVVVTEDAYIWAAPNFDTDGCVKGGSCRLYLKSRGSADERRRIHYDAHIRIASNGDEASAEIDTEIREKITAVVQAPIPDGVLAGTEVSQGDIISSTAPFTPTNFSHLHYGVFDACENYDLVNPLATLLDPDGFEDTTRPTVRRVALVADNEAGNFDPIPTPNYCDTAQAVAGSRDIVAEMSDVYHIDPELPDGSDVVTVHSADYILRRVGSTTAVPLNTWFRFDQLPWFCQGVEQGVPCPEDDPAGGNGAIDQPRFIQIASIVEGFPPHMGTNFDSVLYRIDENLNAASIDCHNNLALRSSGNFLGDQQCYVPIVSHRWAEEGAFDTSMLDDGFYQISVIAADEAGNQDVGHRFLRVQNGGEPPQVPPNLVIRDNRKDVGAVPSTLGGYKHYRSPDIKVGGINDPTPGPNDPVWDEVQTIKVEVGQPKKLWVRVENRSCASISNFTVGAYTAEPALIPDEWISAAPEQLVTATIPPAQGPNNPPGAVVVEFVWTPVIEATAHRCIVAAVHSNDDPSSVPFDGAFRFDQVGVATSQLVAGDNNLGQRNVTISDGTGSANDEAIFRLGNPFDVPQEIGVRFECNGFPMGADHLAQLTFDRQPQLEQAWNDVVGTELVVTEDAAFLEFLSCRVDLPDVQLPANTLVDARMLLETGSTELHIVELTALIDGEPAGGMGFVGGDPEG